MEKQIDFLGVNLTPYSDISPDGGLAVCSGLERHAGSLRPVVLHGTSYALPEDKTDVRLLAVHDTASFSHFIFQDSSQQLYWSSPTTSQALETFGEPLSGEASVKALGNTLIAIDEEGMHYYLWQDGQYMYLGRQMPHLPLVLGLQGNVVEQSTEIEIKGDYSALKDNSSMSSTMYFTEEDRAAINNVLPGFVNQLLSNYKSYNQFVYPFFARWGYETVFGDMLFSPPVLMIPNSGGTVNVQSTLDAKTNCDFFVTFFSTVLDYSLADFETWKAELTKWKDIITGISFYVSDPIAAYVSDGQYSHAFNSNNPIQGIGARRAAGFGILGNAGEGYWRQFSNKAYYSLYVQTPVITDEEYYEKFRTTSVFWKVATIKPDGLTGNAVVQMDANTLVNLGTQEHIEDEPLGEHDQLIPHYSFVYNQRLHIANVTRRLFSFQAETLFTHEAGHSGRTEYRYTFYVFCNDNGGEQVVKCYNEEISTAANFYWLYYPNPSAYKAVIERTVVSSGEKRYAEVQMKEHPAMNGAYFFNDFYGVDFSADAGFSVEEQPLVDNPNKMYTSDVGTPFYFPTSGINTVGVGDILGLATVTTALSQGQFGQYPLMVFCSDGNYALQVSSEGLFSNVSPMQRDVCTNPESITQTDGAIIFVSAKGVMTADGSNIQCISEVLDGVPDEMASLCLTDPNSFFQHCLVAYDYAGRRLIFLSKEDETAWLMSLEDASWSQAGLGTVAAIVNVYPYSYIQFVERHEVLRLDKAYPYAGETVYTGKLLTRPLKLDSLQLKSIHQFVLEGSYSHVQKMTLYASNNGRQWLKLGESTSRRVLTPGRYFKYYRIGIDTSLTEAENLSGVRVDYALRPERRYR